MEGSNTLGEKQERKTEAKQIYNFTFDIFERDKHTAYVVIKCILHKALLSLTDLNNPGK